MTWWPGWDSIEGANAWGHFWFWFGIGCLFLLGASEIVAFRYGLRKDILVAAEQKQKDEAAEKTITDLRTRQTPRRLSAEQKTALVAALSPFPGQKISVMTLANDSEAKDFAMDFLYVFNVAKWDAGLMYGFPAGDNPTGIQVVVNNRVPENQPPPAARALVKELVESGVLAGTNDRFEIHLGASIPLGTLALRIGTKLLPVSAK